jgi:hypothetical protein
MLGAAASLLGLSPSRIRRRKLADICLYNVVKQDLLSSSFPPKDSPKGIIRKLPWLMIFPETPSPCIQAQ